MVALTIVSLGWDPNVRPQKQSICLGAFMVHAIAEELGNEMPSFFGYMRVSFVPLLPVMLFVTLLFFL